MSACLLAFLPQGDLIIKEHVFMWRPVYPFIASRERLWARPLPRALGELIPAEAAAARKKGRLPLRHASVLWGAVGNVMRTVPGKGCLVSQNNCWVMWTHTFIQIIGRPQSDFPFL